jgi:hypothetical protein
LQDRAAAARWFHRPKVGGSSPSPATNFLNMKVAVILLAAASFPPFNRGENPGDVLIVEQELANDLINANLAEMAPEQPQVEAPKEEKVPAEPKKEEAPTETITETAPEATKEEVPAEPKPTSKKK